MGHAFNFNSPIQLSQVLYEELKLPGGRKTKSGHGSTDAAVLEGLKGAHPVIEPILEHRQLSKLKSTYVDALPVLCDPATGRVHTTFNQTGSRHRPNLLRSANLGLSHPHRHGQSSVRRTILAGSPDRVLVERDYSQFRAARVGAHDPGRAAHRGVRETRISMPPPRREVFGLEPEQVTADERRLANVVNFGVLYGMGRIRSGTAIGPPSSEAMGFIDRYFAKFGTVRAYQKG